MPGILTGRCVERVRVVSVGAVVCLCACLGDNSAKKVCDAGEVETGGRCATLCNTDSDCPAGEHCPDPTLPCQLEVCGDGVQTRGEACDLGASNSDNGACTRGCALARCGDGLVRVDGVAPERCDEGAQNGTGIGRCLSDCSGLCAALPCAPGERTVKAALVPGAGTWTTASGLRLTGRLDFGVSRVWENERFRLRLTQHVASPCAGGQCP